MKDCTNCKRKPEAGANYSTSPCAHCKPWEVSDDDSRTVHMTHEQIERLPDNHKHDS
jgi:hypothetical protein